MDAPWFGFVLGILATWRVAHFLAHEDGPWNAVVHLRHAAGDGVFGHLLDCFQCVSLWVAVPIAFVVGRDPIEWILAWLALSAGACLLQRVARDPVMIQTLDREGGDDELLRAEAIEPGGARGNQAVGADNGRGASASSLRVGR